MMAHNAQEAQSSSTDQESGQLEEARRSLGRLGQRAERGRQLKRLDLEEAAESVKSMYELVNDPKQVEPHHHRVVTLWQDYVKACQARYSESLSEIQSRYPYCEGPMGVRPTRLGNIMAAAWSYPYTRYGIDAALMWPRVQRLISADYLRVVEDARISYDFTVAMAFLAFLHAVLWLSVLLVQNLLWQWILLPVMGVLAAVLLYLAAIEAARTLGAYVRTCFDLFRFPLLQELRMKRPVSLFAERMTWDKINQVMAFGDVAKDLEYVHSPE
jgi:hypothetical protein